MEKKVSGVRLSLQDVKALLDRAKSNRVAVGAGGVMFSGLAMAQSGGLDVTGITGALTNAGTAIGTIALAMLGVAGAGMAVKWVLGFVFS